MQKLLLSIITVVKNDEKNIQKTIKSIISQKNVKYEYIIIDGKSTDNTLKKILKYKSKINKIISKKDKGIYDAMNKGLKIANGEVIVFCNSGDFFYKNSFSLYINGNGGFVGNYLNQSFFSKLVSYNEIISYYILI